MIEYRYLRPMKAKQMKRREDADFPRIKIRFQIHHDCTILPRVTMEHDDFPFGRGDH